MSKSSVCHYRKFYIKENIIHLELEGFLPMENEAWILLSYQNEWDECIKKIPVIKELRKNKTILKCDIDLKETPLKMVEWKIGLLVVDRKESYEIPCVVNRPFLRKQFYFRDKSLKHITNNGEIYFLFLIHDYQVLIVHREHSIFDDAPYRNREILAKICYLMTKRFWEKQNILLFFEKESQTTQDNGWYFYNYCRENHVFKECNAKAYFVSKKQDSKRGCLEFFSFRHMMYLQAAKLLISSESREQAVVWRNRNSFLRDSLDEKKLFFLQHGIIGLKKLPHFHREKGGTCDIFIASSEKEKSYIINELGYTKEQVKVTGLARYDTLKDTSSQQGKKYLLIMPTWRPWLDDVSVDTFCKSNFYKEYDRLIRDEELIKFLETNQLNLVFCLHPKAQKYQNHFTNIHPAIRIIFYKNDDLQSYIKGCSMLVTDYSSIAWDVYYLRKPIVFFQFDLQEYLDKCGAYLNLKAGELFGKQVTNEKDLLTEIKQLFEHTFCMDKKYLRDRDNWFAFQDQNNCERISKELLTYIEEIF